MRQEEMDTPYVGDGAQQTALQSIPADGSSPAALRRGATSSALSAAELAAHCLGEIDNYRLGKPYNEAYGLELLCRAIIQGDQEARAWMQHCLSEIVCSWLRLHPSREAALRLESEENYVAQAFERFWQATTMTQRVEFNWFSAALQHLLASLNGAILDTLRTYARPREVPMPEQGASPLEEQTSNSGVWEILQTMLPNKREKRLAYLLYHCGLNPREIVRFCSQEWSDVREIYRLRCNIMERLLRNADQLR